MAKKTLRIFLSYASEQRDIAEEIESALTVAGYTVFFDKKSLPVGEEYNRKIYAAIRASDLMIFLISPDSIEAGSYARTELMFAQEIWKNPDRRVFPIRVKEVDFSEIPGYLKSVTILSPSGNISAEVLKAVDAFASDDKNKTIFEITEELSEKIEKQKIENILAKIDEDWEEERKKYTVRINGFDTNYVPATYLIGVFPLGIGIVLAIFGYSNFYFAGGLPTIFPLLLGIGGAIYFCKGVKEYKEKEKDYQRKRESVISSGVR